jgi:hypothetical protein
MILSVVLYGCETWSLTLRDKHKLECSRTGCEEWTQERRYERGLQEVEKKMEFYIFYSSRRMIRILKSRMMRWACHVTRMGKKINAYWVLVEGKGHWKDLDVGERTILKWIIEKYDGWIWIGFIWLRIGTSGGLLGTG